MLRCTVWVASYAMYINNAGSNVWQSQNYSALGPVDLDSSDRKVR